MRYAEENTHKWVQASSHAGICDPDDLLFDYNLDLHCS